MSIQTKLNIVVRILKFLFEFVVILCTDLYTMA